MKFSLFLLLLNLFLLTSCNAQTKQKTTQPVLTNEAETHTQNILPGATQTHLYVDRLKNLRIGVVANQTSMVYQTHLIDTLLSRGLNIVKVYTPEHGFRGQADAGERIQSEIDSRTGLPIISLYGERRKPAAVDLHGIDYMIIDLQDVGTRFYTYISTMSLVMEACAEQNIPVLVLDRPNPNGFYIDGPVLQKKHSSFVGMHPIPVVHGLTMAEYANMVNGEGWLKNGIVCELQWVLCEGYDHKSMYALPVKPSPNLPDMESILLYPTLCFFEGTKVSVGRGTPNPFTIIGYPGNTQGTYTFTPVSTPGASNPPYKDQVCYGYNLRDSASLKVPSLRLQWLIKMYSEADDKSDFFNAFFTKLAGTEDLRKQIEMGTDEKTIRKSWESDLQNYKVKRKKYLLYTDFE